MSVRLLPLRQQPAMLMLDLTWLSGLNLQVLKQNGNLLMLDEPTNDADVDLLRALENAIMQWPGTVLCISHDRYFLDRSALQRT